MRNYVVLDKMWAWSSTTISHSSDKETSKTHFPFHWSPFREIFCWWFVKIWCCCWSKILLIIHSTIKMRLNKFTKWTSFSSALYLSFYEHFGSLDMKLYDTTIWCKWLFISELLSHYSSEFKKDNLLGSLHKGKFTDQPNDIFMLNSRLLS